ncbi:hypothetical protein [Rhizorhabdus sp.]|uniref:hypothetical protein n=1 Tax=Rhizorhabdus sp. TaxID=1968843 RepID=UPI0025E0AC49|nr:hypothetical protein [Rhizorhabdus sp.]
MNGNLNPSAMVAVLGAINPSSQAAGALSTGWVDMQDWFNAMAIVHAGALGASATLDAKIQQATDGSGTGAKDVTGLAITQLTKAGSDDNKQAIINIRQEDLDRNNGFRYVRLTMTVATAASLTSALLLGLNPRYGAANAGDAASVDEIVG